MKIDILFSYTSWYLEISMPEIFDTCRRYLLSSFLSYTFFHHFSPEADS